MRQRLDSILSIPHATLRNVVTSIRDLRGSTPAIGIEAQPLANLNALLNAWEMDLFDATENSMHVIAINDPSSSPMLVNRFFCAFKLRFATCYTV